MKTTMIRPIAAMIASTLAVSAQEATKPCASLSPEQLAILFQMIEAGQRQAGPTISPQALQSFVQAFQQLQQPGTPAAAIGNHFVPGRTGIPATQSQIQSQVAVAIRQDGRDVPLKAGDRKVAIVKSDANDITEVFKNEAWLQGSQIAVRAVNEEITKMILSNRELGKWLWRVDSSGAVGRIGGKFLSRPKKARVYEVEFVPGLASTSVAPAGTSIELLVASQAVAGYEPVLFIAERRDKDGIRVISSRKMELTPQMGASGPESVGRKIIGMPQEKRMQLDVQAGPDGRLVIKPVQPLGAGEYALVFLKRDTGVIDSLPGAFDFRVGQQ